MQEHEQDASGSASPAPGMVEDGPREGTEAPAASLESRLAAALAEAQRLREDFLRAKAETENTRRRAAEDVSKAHKYGIESFAKALLGVRDSLDAALSAPVATAESIRQGVELTARQFDAAFERFALKPIAPAAGEKFDPHRHQAIGQVESDQEPNTVVQVLQKGFLLHDRVIRPALVTVAKARESAPAA